MQTHYLTGSEAYDFEKFAPKQRVRVRKPRMTVVPMNQKLKARAQARARVAAALKVLATVAVLGAVVVAMLYSRALLTELGAQISRQNALYEEYKSESTRLSAELESKVSLRNVEEYATQTLGMSVVDKHQITYVDLCEGDKVELTDESPRLTLLDRIRVAVSNVKEYIPQG